MGFTGIAKGTAKNAAKNAARSAAQSEPYLWLHLAGIAALPLCLELCLAGLRACSGLPRALLLLLVALAGIAPIAWMQWRRPFCIFSLIVLALKPEQLNETQRRIVAQFKAPIGKVVTVIAAGLALVILWQMNQWIPGIRLVQFAGGRWGGLLLAMGSFLLANLFLQVPASVLPVLLTQDNRLMPPYPAAKIPQDFTLIGLRVKQILPAVIPVATPAPGVTPAPVTTPAPKAVSPSVPEASQLTAPPASKAKGNPLISVAASESAESINPDPAPTIIHALTELIPSASKPSPQASYTVVKIVTDSYVTDARGLSAPDLAPATTPAEPAAPHVRNTIVRIIIHQTKTSPA